MIEATNPQILEQLQNMNNHLDSISTLIFGGLLVFTLFFTSWGLAKAEEFNEFKKVTKEINKESNK